MRKRCCFCCRCRMGISCRSTRRYFGSIDSYKTGRSLAKATGLFFLLMVFFFNTAGLRPRPTPDSFYTPKKSRQKKAPQLLALRVPYAAQTFYGRGKTRCAQTFPRLIVKCPLRSGCVTGDGGAKGFKLEAFCLSNSPYECRRTQGFSSGTEGRMSERSEFSSCPDYNLGERDPAAGGPTGATFFWLLF